MARLKIGKVFIGALSMEPSRIRITSYNVCYTKLLRLDWSDYKDSGMGDAYADIPKIGGDFAKAVAVCIRSGVCEQHGRGVMCPSFRVTENPLLSPGGRVTVLRNNFV